jgi:hypothetical protein
VHAVLFVALAAGVFGLLPRLGGVAHDAVEPWQARPGFSYWLPMPAGAVAYLWLRLFTPKGSAAKASTPAARPA